MRYVRMIYLVGYSLSLTTLAVAVAIMLYIKSVLPTTCLLALNRHTCNCRRPSLPRPHQHTCRCRIAVAVAKCLGAHFFGTQCTYTENKTELGLLKTDEHKTAKRDVCNE